MARVVALKAYIRLDGWVGEIDLIVLDDDDHVSESMIIGFDFLKRYNGLIGTSSLTINSMKISAAAEITSPTKLDLPPNSETIVRVNVDKQISINRLVIAEPFDHTGQGLLMAHSIDQVRPNQQIHVKLLNFTDKVVQIEEKQRLGVACPVDAESQTEHEDEWTRKKIENFKFGGQLKSTEKKEIVDILFKFRQVFSRNESDLGRTTLTKHTIKLNNNQPIKMPPYSCLLYTSRRG